jgi:DNA-binding transcriptional regulator YiaG
MTIKDMRTRTGLTQAQFAELLHIPKRTIENWEHEVNKCPEYTIKLIDYFLTHEGVYKTKEE